MDDLEARENEKPKFKIIEKTSRHGKWTIEIPNVEGVNIFEKVVVSALEECDPRVRRKDAFVQFLDRMVEDGKRKTIHVKGATVFSKKKRTISLSIDLPLQITGRTGNRLYPSWHLNVLKTLLHEIFEEDYWCKSEGKNVQQKNADEPDYLKAEHEKIADKRALRHLRKVFGLNYVVQYGMIYTPDKYSTNR